MGSSPSTGERGDVLKDTMPGSSDSHGGFVMWMTRNWRWIRTCTRGWWDISTGFPVLAGTFCSMAIMFHICALVKGWQQSVPEDGSMPEKSTPSWEIGLKAASLAISIVAYMVYLLTMTLHTHWHSIVGFVVTVIGWLASAIILFILIGVEVRRHENQAFNYTENFFAGIMSACLYALVAILLAIYVVSLKFSHFRPEDRRRIECTSLVLRVTFFSILLLGGAAVYSAIEGWSLMDALYFTDYTVLTIGLGNLTPKTHLGRSLLSPYSTLGITSLGFFISAVAKFTHSMRELKLKYKIEETRRQVELASCPQKTANDLQSQKEKESQISPVKGCVLEGEEIFKIRNVKCAFYRRRRWVELWLFLGAWFFLWLVSAAIFRSSEKGENWSYFIALYFTFTSLTSIGYGDYYPTSNFGKVYFIFWSLVAIPVLTNLVTALGGLLRICLIFCSEWVWRHVFRRKHPREHHVHKHDSESYSLDMTEWIARKNSAQSWTQDPNLNIGAVDSEQRHSNTRQDSSSALYPDGWGDLDDGNRHKSMSQRNSTQYWLRLSEEIGNLISVVRNESPEHQEELCCIWSKIIPLLQVKGDAGSLSELTPLFATAKSENMTMGTLMDTKDGLSERNAQIMWMLSLLVEKLSSDLRKEAFETIN